MVKTIFSSSIIKEDQGIYYQFRKQLFEIGKSQSCELRMVRKESQTFWVHLDATVAQDTDSQPVSRIVMSDITELKLKEAHDLLEQMVEKQTQQLRRETEAPPAEGADTILLVDDEPHILAAMTRSLTNTGYEVFTAAGGSQALAIMETRKIKVIVSDEQMEGMRGSELLAEVQKRFPLTLRILVSGYTTQEMAMRAVNEGGIYRFFAKPWDDALLRLALSAATEKYNLEAEKRHLQDALQQSEERYKSVVEFSPHAVVVHRDGRIIYANPAAIKMFGASSLQDLAGSSILDRVHPDDHQSLIAQVKRATGKVGSARLIELKYLRLDGTIFDGEAQGTTIIYDGLPAIHAAICDITDRRQAEKYIEMRQEVLSILNESEDSPDSIQRILAVLKARTGCSAVAIRLQVGEDFPYFAQQGFAEDFLRTENTLISRTADGVGCRDKEGNLQLSCTCGLVIAGHNDPTFPFFTRRGSFWTGDSSSLLDLLSDHDPRHHPRNLCIHNGYACVALVPLRNKNRIVGLIQFNDRRKGHFTLAEVELLEKIAEHIETALARRWAEEALQEAHDLLELRVEERTKQLRLEIEAHERSEADLLESQQRFQGLVESLYVWVWEVDPEGYYTYGSPRIKNILGYEPEEILEKKQFEQMSTEEAQRVLKILGPFLAEKKPFINLENINLHKDGYPVVIETSGRPFYDDRGNFSGYRGTDRDITERKQQEEALRVALEAAEVANRAKSLFIGNMSHELRTPLSGVLGMTELLLKTPVTVKQRDYAESIMKCGKSLLVVVSNILDFSKSSAGNMNLESAPFFLDAVIANVVNLFGPSVAEEKKVELTTTIDPEIPALHGDSLRLTQVISNLVGNAVKFTKAGEIRVSAKILRRTETEIDLSIGVQDTGIGMTEEELSRIFSAFTQGDTTTGRRFNGTGLGLTISRNLVELMGGTIQAESVPGKGSLLTVLVTLPVAQGFAKRDLKSRLVASVTPVIFEGPPGDLVELPQLLEKLKKTLESEEPVPCKELLALLLAKSWPKKQETLFAELNRLVKRYRLQEAFDLLNQETEPERAKKEVADTVSATQGNSQDHSYISIY